MRRRGIGRRTKGVDPSALLRPLWDSSPDCDLSTYNSLLDKHCVVQQEIAEKRARGERVSGYLRHPGVNWDAKRVVVAQRAAAKEAKRHNMILLEKEREGAQRRLKSEMSTLRAYAGTRRHSASVPALGVGAAASAAHGAGDADRPGSDGLAARRRAEAELLKDVVVREDVLSRLGAAYAAALARRRAHPLSDSETAYLAAAARRATRRVRRSVAAWRDVVGAGRKCIWHGVDYEEKMQSDLTPYFGDTGEDASTSDASASDDGGADDGDGRREGALPPRSPPGKPGGSSTPNRGRKSPPPYRSLSPTAAVPSGLSVTGRAPSPDAHGSVPPSPAAAARAAAGGGDSAGGGPRLRASDRDRVAYDRREAWSHNRQLESAAAAAAAAAEGAEEDSAADATGRSPALGGESSSAGRGPPSATTPRARSTRASSELSAFRGVSGESHIRDASGGGSGGESQDECGAAGRQRSGSSGAEDAPAGTESGLAAGHGGALADERGDPAPALQPAGSPLRSPSGPRAPSRRVRSSSPDLAAYGVDPSTSAPPRHASAVVHAQHANAYRLLHSRSVAGFPLWNVAENPLPSAADVARVSEQLLGQPDHVNGILGWHDAAVAQMRRLQTDIDAAAVRRERRRHMEDVAARQGVDLTPVYATAERRGFDPGAPGDPEFDAMLLTTASRRAVAVAPATPWSVRNAPSSRPDPGTRRAAAAFPLSGGAKAAGGESTAEETPVARKRSATGATEARERVPVAWRPYRHGKARAPRLATAGRAAVRRPRQLSPLQSRPASTPAVARRHAPAQKGGRVRPTERRIGEKSPAIVDHGARDGQGTRRSPVPETQEPDASPRPASRLNKALPTADGIMSLKNLDPPPPAAVLALASTLILLEPGEGLPPALDWGGALKAVLVNPDGFVKRLETFSASSIPRFKVRALRTFVAQPLFRPEEIEEDSPTAARLCAWVLRQLATQPRYLRWLQEA